jgi:hypothetical protein
LYCLLTLPLLAEQIPAENIHSDSKLGGESISENCAKPLKSVC